MSDGGRIRLDGADLGRTPPEARPVGVVFPGLCAPHLSALDNVAFGPRCQGVPKAAAREQAARWLDRMGLAEHAGPPSRAGCAGGQAQRVALARALWPPPAAPARRLAALDARTRLDVRSQLRRHLSDFEAVAVLVTHDPLDAMVLADRLVVVEHGRVVQEGTPSDIARHPRTDYIAQLVGLNLYRGAAEGHAVRPGHGSGDRHDRGPDRARLSWRSRPVPSRCTATVRPAPARATSGGARSRAWRRTATRSARTSPESSRSPRT